MKKRLFDMQIDEVSLVDRPANQHATIAFSKADTDTDVIELDSVVDDEGNQIDLDSLSPGDEIVGEDGETYVILEDDVDEVGKARQFAVNAAGKATEKTFGTALAPGAKKGNEKLLQLKTGFQRRGMDSEGASRAYKVGGHLGRNRTAYGVGAAGAGAGAGGYGVYDQTRKSEDGMTYTDQILEELSKAVTETEREGVIAKMASELDETRQAAAEAIAKAEEAEYREVEREFISKAAGYNLPVNPEEFGPIVMKMAIALDEAEFELVDKVFSSVGQTLYDEIGYVGGGDNASVLDTVDSLADEMVGKSEGRFSKAESMVAMLEANPDAYDAYLAEQAR